MNLGWLGQDETFLVDAGNGTVYTRRSAGPFAAMQSAANHAGIDCQLVSTYRAFDRQLSIWNRKWQGDLPILDLHGHSRDVAEMTEEQKIHGILTWSALPGGSRHHWGTDIDVYDKRSVSQRRHKFELIDSEYRGNGPCAALADWLSHHAIDYGFHRPFLHYTGGVACELWHLSHQQTAHHFEAMRNPQQLAQAIAAAPMQGKQAVLRHFDELFDRYVLNQGV